MNDKEIAELRRRFRADKTSISRIRGAYVNEKREIISEMDQSVAMMTETETDEILSLLKKTLSGKVDTNLIDIHFTTQQVMESPQHKLLCNLRETALQDDELIHSFYKKIIDSLEIEGNYMILLAYDCYDVFTYRKDGNKDDESSEMFRYILCCVCPIKMAKPSLSYYVKENCFRNVVADSVISPPALGFMFPAFDNRSSNIYNALFYTRSPKESHQNLIETLFCVQPPKPAAEQKKSFEALLSTAVAEQCSLDVVQTVHEQLRQCIDMHKESKVAEPLLISKEQVKAALSTCGVSESHVAKFSVEYDEVFGFEAQLHPKNIINNKQFVINTPDVTVKVNPERSDLIETRVIGGTKYLMICVDDNVEVNGVNIHINNE